MLNEYTHQSAIEDVYVKNGNKFISYLTITGNNAKHLLIYAGTASSTNNNSIRISNLKLELGINPNPKWSPAPEDVMVHSEFEPVLISDFTFTPNGNDTIRYKNVYKYGRLIFLRIGVNLNGNAYSIGRTTYKIDSRYTPLFDISSVITASDNIGSYGNKIATAYISGNTLNVDVFYDNVKDISINCIYIMK